jgi:hypothetical protein
MLRIYRADGSYTTKTWPLATTTSEIIQALSGKAVGHKTGMKLYIRERGQGEFREHHSTRLMT